MNAISAFIYGMVVLSMMSNLIYMMIDAKRMKRESEKLDLMGKDVLKDIEVGQHYIELYSELDERISKLEGTKETKNIKN